jgi:hypothetical protein
MTSGTTNGTATPTAIAATPKRGDGRDHAVQNAWYARNTGKVIRLRFTDGSGISGELVGWDTYTIEIRLAGRAETVLAHKHALSAVLRAEAREDKQAGREQAPEAREA